ncbi:MAG: DNA polymerase III subunit alpha, partial [Fimbriimonas ginsengisoli]|nr:DNA polymerase III subunit alpha [Fimbriimonas ginsengisoli]
LYGSDNVYVEIERSFLPWQASVEAQALQLAHELGLKPIAGGAITHARPSHFPAQDVIACIDTLCLIEDIVGRKPLRDPSRPQIEQPPRRAINAERYFRSASEMGRLFTDRPDLLARTLEVADRCADDVLPKRTRLPSLFEDDAHALREIVEVQSMAAYGRVAARQKWRLAHELDRIQRLGFATHFLVAWDLCRWAREQEIQMSGRGSVIDSAVAYVLGFSRIDAVRHKLHFDRFLPDDGSKRPDIDIDFEARRRDDVRGYMVRKYGVDRVATVAAVGTYNTRGIVREVGKVFGLPDETIGFLAKRIHGGVPPDQLESALQGRPELRDAQIPKERFRWVFALAERLMDLPRNIRCHSSGVVVSDRPLAETVPVMWSASGNAEESGWADEQLRIIQWDKRSAKHVFDKFDILCLRGQDVLSGVERSVRLADPDFSVERVAATEDPEVYRAMRSGELIGVPQSASPAMRQAHVRLKTNDLHDASLVQAGIRPGVGGAVKINELIARRRGKPYSFEHPDLEAILGHTYGIIVFQEQVDELLQKICGYTSGEAEEIRDAIHKRRREDYGATIRDEVVVRALAKGYSPSVAERVIDYVAGFKGYGFAQGHALAFAEVSLRSVSMMQNHPAEYFASLLSAQPAGYYGPATIANEARTRGVAMLPLDVNRSCLRFEVENLTIKGLTVPNAAIRVGLIQLSGLSEGTKQRILEQQALALERPPDREAQPLKSVERQGAATAVALRERPLSVPEPGGGKGPHGFASIFEFAARVQPDRDELEALILAGAFEALHPNRRALLWAMPSIAEYAATARSLLEGGSLPLLLAEPSLPARVEDFQPEEKAVYERSLLGMDVAAHLMAFERDRVAVKGGITSADAKRLPDGACAFVVGNPIRLRFPPTSSGKRVVFFDLEDETGLLNVTCFDDVYRRDGHAIVCSSYVTVIGQAQDRDGFMAFLASRVIPYHPGLAKRLPSGQPLPLASADFLVG